MDIMKKTKIEQYLQGPLWALLILAFVDIVFFFLDIRCGVILAVSLVVFLVFQMIIYSRSKQEIIKECMDFMFEQSQVQNYLLQQLPVPYALLDGNGMIIWSNDAFHKIVGENRGKSLQQIFPNLNRNLLPSDVMHSISHIEYKKKCKEGDKEKEQTLFYKVEMNRIRVEDFSDENDNSCSRQMLKDNDLIAVYFFDQTLLKKYMEQNENQRMVIGLIYIDNYEEILDDIDAVKRSMLIAVADRKINKFIQNVSGVVKRTERDKYFVVFEQKYLDKIKENKFSILDEIKTINLGNSMHMTLSISFGINGNTYQENYEAACAGMDLALGRGGDQAVIKDGEDISYYGGNCEVMERTTRVKARVKAHALKELLESKEKVVIMAHKIPDPDAIGAAVGLYRLGLSLGRKAHIVMNEVTISVRAMVDELNKELNTYVSIILDTNGPDLRIGLINEDKTFLKQDTVIRIYKEDVLGDETKSSVNYEDFVNDVKIGNTISINDGAVELVTEEKCESYLKCRVVKEGFISSKSDVHVVGIKLNIPFLRIIVF